MQTTVSDEQLVDSIKKGNVLAYEDLVRRYQQKLYIYAVRLLNNHDAALDIVQDTLFSIYTHIDSIDCKRKFSSYIFAALRNAAFSYFRKNKRHVRTDIMNQLEADEQIYAALFRKDTVREVKRALRALDAISRELVELYYYNDNTYEEIAKRKKLPLNTVRTKLRRAKLKLRNILDTL